MSRSLIYLLAGIIITAALILYETQRTNTPSNVDSLIDCVVVSPQCNGMTSLLHSVYPAYNPSSNSTAGVRQLIYGISLAPLLGLRLWDIGVEPHLGTVDFYEALFKGIWPNEHPLCDLDNALLTRSVPPAAREVHAVIFLVPATASYSIVQGVNAIWSIAEILNKTAFLVVMNETDEIESVGRYLVPESRIFRLHKTGQNSTTSILQLFHTIMHERETLIQSTQILNTSSFWEERIWNCCEDIISVILQNLDNQYFWMVVALMIFVLLVFMFLIITDSEEQRTDAPSSKRDFPCMVQAPAAHSPPLLVSAVSFPTTPEMSASPIALLNNASMPSEEIKSLFDSIIIDTVNTEIHIESTIWLTFVSNTVVPAKTEAIVVQPAVEDLSPCQQSDILEPEVLSMMSPIVANPNFINNMVNASAVEIDASEINETLEQLVGQLTRVEQAAIADSSSLPESVIDEEPYNAYAPETDTNPGASTLACGEGLNSEIIFSDYCDSAPAGSSVYLEQDDEAEFEIVA